MDSDMTIIGGGGNRYDHRIIPFVQELLDECRGTLHRPAGIVVKLHVERPTPSRNDRCDVCDGGDKENLRYGKSRLFFSGFSYEEVDHRSLHNDDDYFSNGNGRCKSHAIHAYGDEVSM